MYGTRCSLPRTLTHGAAHSTAVAGKVPCRIVSNVFAASVRREDRMLADDIAVSVWYLSLDNPAE